MTLTTTKPVDKVQAPSAQQHHLNAADHLSKAAHSHQEAAKLLEYGEHKAAASQADIAKEHTAHAAAHVIEAAKKSAAAAPARK